MSETSIGQLALIRWCCYYGLLWVGTAFSIASVSVCDFYRASVQSDDDFLFGGIDHYESKGGLFCARIEDADGKVLMKLRYSEFYGEIVNSKLITAQAFGVMAAIFISMALILFHVAFFVKLRNLAMAKGIWWTIRVLSIAALVSVSVPFYIYNDNGCTPSNDVHVMNCRMGPGAILSAINIILLIILTVCLFVSGPPQSPFRCACISCKEGPPRNGNVETATVSPNTAEFVKITTTEEVMEDGRRCITA